MGLPRIECVILAAGSSNRLGRDKALIRIGVGTLVEWLSERVSNRGVDVTVVANKTNLGEISAKIPESNVVENTEPQKGRTGSLKVGISNIDFSKGPNYRLLVVPVDRPGFSDSTLERLIGSEESCCPMLEGKGGHPLLLSLDDVDRVRGSSEDTPLREIVDPVRFEVIDRTLHLNIDTPSDIEELEQKLIPLLKKIEKYNFNPEP
jgi:CTP:molybdopterin cytidylyltransferase MocA|tara:strand:+ start:3958 stop:4575 length:618 start_codon:yes stop_codon:yes gene_type:complete